MRKLEMKIIEKDGKQKSYKRKSYIYYMIVYYFTRALFYKNYTYRIIQDKCTNQFTLYFKDKLNKCCIIFEGVE